MPLFEVRIESGRACIDALMGIVILESVYSTPCFGVRWSEYKVRRKICDLSDAQLSKDMCSVDGNPGTIRIGRDLESNE